MLDAGVPPLGARTQAGVIAFGNDEDIRKAFAHDRISALDLHTFSEERLSFYSSEKGLMLDALCAALTRELPLSALRGRDSTLLHLRPDEDDSRLLALREIVGCLRGEFEQLPWAEALRVQLDFKLGRLWFIVEPTVWVQRTDDLVLRHSRAAWINARLRSRFNRCYYDILKAWLIAMFVHERQATFRAIGDPNSSDAVFVANSSTGLSGRT